MIDKKVVEPIAMDNKPRIPPGRHPTTFLMAGNSEDDQALIERIRAGDISAFDPLIKKYRPRLSRVVSLIVANPAEVEEIVQETFLKVFRGFDGFRGEAAFYTWVYRIGINTARNHGRRQSRLKAVFIQRGLDFNDSWGYDECAGHTDTPESILSSKQIEEKVCVVIEALPLGYQLALILREFEGLSYKQISVAMSCPIGTVRARLFRARELVSKELKPLLEAQTNERW